ncbi:MAG: hypothetical protein H7X92_10380 [Chitinophagales bacterium]|nr:hypothetical protein [Hyphomicrobiales bacterium]
MRRPVRNGSVRPPKDDKWALPRSLRDRVALLLTAVTVVCLVFGLVLTTGAKFLMPGPLASAHGAIDNCGSCHTKNGNGKLGWIHGLVAGDPLADSKACITCHKMPDNLAFNAHGASAGVLRQSTERLTKVAAVTPAPQSARAQHIAFPTDKVVESGLYCATCHQDHQGVNFDLNKISNEQCRSCHVVKFDSFDGDHPTFENYPFERRTRIIYDHASHFGKHFPEIAQKDKTKRIPETCSTCHNSNEDKRVMGVASFDQTCATCHLDQIMGKERVSGPKGIAFLSLPGLDIETLKSKNAAIGEWPDTSEAEVTPFMKVLLSQDEAGRALVRKIEKLNLQDLTDASDEDITAVTKFVWRVKKLFHSLVVAKSSTVVAKLDLGGGVKVGKDLIVNLTASIPRDSIVGAQREWLPNLGKEMANRKDAANDTPVKKKTNFSEKKLAAQVAPEELRASAKPASPDADMRLAQAGNPQRASDQTDDLLYPDGGAPPPAASGPSSKPAAATAPAAEANNAADDSSASADAENAVDADRPKAATAPPTAAAIESDVDAESWADFGGWYRQDFAIFYRPVGHKDKFIYTWLSLTGMQSPKGLVRPSAAVFDALTNKDAQGSCTKCHSVDDEYGKGRRVNFSPVTAKMKEGRFTKFIHEPHYGVMENRGCLTCHSLEKGKPYLKSYEEGNPLRFSSSFSNVKKDLCQTCHATNATRQDCLTCHKYHVNEVITPIMTTKIPEQ